MLFAVARCTTQHTPPPNNLIGQSWNRDLQHVVLVHVYDTILNFAHFTERMAWARRNQQAPGHKALYRRGVPKSQMYKG